MNKDKTEPPSTETEGQGLKPKEAAQKDGDGGFQGHLKYTALALLIPFLLCLAPALWIDSQISYQQVRNQFLEQEITAAEQHLQDIADFPDLRAQYLGRIAVYSHVRSDNWPDVVQLLGELSRRLPDGISLRSVKLQGGKLALSGIALSGEAVELFNQLLSESGLPSASALKITLTETKGGRFIFTLSQKEVSGSDLKGGGL
jgi:type IV pilus assembly protein PilN